MRLKNDLIGLEREDIRADPMTQITPLEAEIYARVAHLYELTEEEYPLILNKAKPQEPFRVAALNCYRDMAKRVMINE